MSRCVGPLLPIDDFEDPAAARARYERLRQGDGEPSSFVSIEPPRCDIVHLEPGVAVRATMQVPSRAALFADHFPRRAVYPATLLLDRQMRLVQPLLPGRDWQARSVTHVKIGAFVLPGDELTLEASLMSDAGDERLFALVGFRGETRISRARAHYVRCGV
jgi:hypothetical protein